MGIGEYMHYCGTIGFALTNIADGLGRHGYALISEEDYQTWISLETFRSEESAVVRKRDRSIAHFEDEDGRKWDVTTYKCIHIYFPLQDANWRFVERIECDGKVFAKSKTTIAAYEKLVREAQKKAKEKEAYFRRVVARWLGD